MAGCDPPGEGGPRILTDVTSISGLAEPLSLSRTQLSRKFAEAEAMGNAAGAGTRGEIRLWPVADFSPGISRGAGGRELAIIDAAFEACV